MFQSEVVKLASDGLMRDVTSLQQVNSELKHDNRKLNEENKRLVAKNNTLRRKLIRFDLKRVNQLIKRKDASVKLWKDKYRKLRLTADSAVKTEQKLRQTLKELQRLKGAKVKQAERSQRRVHSVEQERSRMTMEMWNTKQELVLTRGNPSVLCTSFIMK